MSYTDKNTELGNHVAFAVNNKGTGRRGVPSAIAELSKTETAPATADPTKLKATGSNVKGLRQLGKRKIKSKI